MDVDKLLDELDNDFSSSSINNRSFLQNKTKTNVVAPSKRKAGYSSDDVDELLASINDLTGNINKSINSKSINPSTVQTSNIKRYCNPPILSSSSSECDNLFCTNCDFSVVCIPNFVWRKSVEYYDFRNANIQKDLLLKLGFFKRGL
jgi:hypothetical protein